MTTSPISLPPLTIQSANCLVKHTWRTLVQTDRTYLTNKQIPWEYWYWAILHGSRILNHAPVRLNRKLNSPSEIVNGTKLDTRTWFKLFSLVFFHHQVNSTVYRSKTQSQTMAGIAVYRCPSSNMITFYNLNNCSYYNPPSYRLEKSHHPSSYFSCHIKYDGTIIMGLYCEKRNPTPKPFPPGTPIPLLRNGETQSATVEHLPLIPVDGPTPTADPPCLLRFYNIAAIEQK